MTIKFFKEEDDRVYLGLIIPVKRGIKNKNKPVVDELLVLAFNKQKKPELYLKIKEMVKNTWKQFTIYYLCHWYLF